MVSKSKVKEKWVLLFNGIWMMNKVPEIDCGYSCTTMYMYLALLNLYLEMVIVVIFMLYIFYHN